MSLSEIVELCISWVPTVLFLLIVLWAALVGLIRGFRKSLILLINASISALILIIAYFIVVNSKALDTSIVNTINSTLASMGEGSLQTMLDVSPECSSLTEILTEYLPKQMNLGEGMAIVIAENGAYLGALVNSVYHIIYAIALSFIYPFVVFIFYIVYLCVFREGKYKKRKKKAYEEDPENNTPYKKRRLFGSLVGMARGMVVGLVWLSFLGTILFIVTGDNGKNNDIDVEFGNEQINEYYDIYESIASYGDKGIYSILNVLHNRNDVPYYLFIADIVLSGSYKDVENKVNAEIIYRKEFAAYTKFARETIELLYTHGPEYFDQIIEGSFKDQNEMLSILSEIFKSEGFQSDFSKMIDEFESDTFVINFALSFVDSFARNIDKQEMISTMNPDTVEVLKLLLTGEDAITVSNILNKEDAKILLNTVIDVIASDNLVVEDTGNASEEGESGSQNILSTVKLVGNVLPKFKNLSMFKDEAKRGKANRVLSNVYSYIVTKIDNSEDSVEEVSKKLSALSDTNTESIDWMSEVEMLIDSVPDALTIYENSYVSDGEGGKKFAILHILDAGNENLEANEAALDNLINNLSGSDLLGAVLSMTFVEDAITQTLSGIAEGMVFPSDVNYINKYDSQGDLTEKGELYSVLTSLKTMMKNGIADVVDEMGSEGANQTQTIKKMIDILLIGTEGETALDHLVDSKLLTYTLSHILFNFNLGEEFKLVFPETALEKTNDLDAEGKPYKIIKKDEIKDIVVSIDVVLPEDGQELIDIKNIIKNKDKLIESDILHATVINFLVTKFTPEEGEDELIVIPTEYKNAATLEELNDPNNIWYESNEVSFLLDGIDYILGITTSEENFDFNNIDSNKIIDNVFTLNEDANPNDSSDETKLDRCYFSIIIKGTLSKQIDSILSDELVSSEIKASSKDDAGYYKVTEIASLIDAINVLNLDFNNMDSATIKNLVMTLNDDADPEDSSDETKLDICYESTIFKGVLSKQLDSTLDNLMTEDNKNVILSEHSTGVKLFLKADIADAITAINTLGIADVDSINLESVELAKSDIPNIAKSRIIRAILDKNLSDAATNSSSLFVLPNRARDYVNGIYTFLSENEVNSLFNVLWDELGTEVIGDSNKKSISTNINLASLKITSSNVNNFTSSYVVLSTISDKLGSYLYIPSDSLDPALDAESTDIKKEELYNLIVGIEQFQPEGITINVNFDTSNLSLTREKITKALESTIMHYAISSQIVDGFTVDGITSVPSEAYVVDSLYEHNEKNRSLVTKDEINNLVRALQDITIGSSELDPEINISDINISDSNMSISKAKITSILGTYRSYIAHKMITDTITRTLGVVPTTSYEDASHNYIKASEINAIIELIGEGTGDNKAISIGGTNSLSFSTIKINSTLIASSSILSYKVSEQLFGINDNSVLIPADVKKPVSVVGTNETKQWINNTEIKAFLDGIMAIVGETLNIESIAVSFPDAADIEVVSKSCILRATITGKLDIQVESVQVNVICDIEALDSYSTSSMPILNEDEMVKLLNAINIIFESPSFESNLSLNSIAALDASKIYIITSSSVLKNVLTVSIGDTGFTNMFVPNVTSVDIYDGTAMVPYALEDATVGSVNGGKIPSTAISTADYDVYSVQSGNTVKINISVEQNTLQAFFAMLDKVNTGI